MFIGGASLLIAFRLSDAVVVIVGGNQLAVTRATAALDADAKIIVLTPGGRDAVCKDLRTLEHDGHVTILTEDTTSLDAILSTHDSVRMVCVTDTLRGCASSAFHQRSYKSALELHRTCRTHRIPVNVADYPSLCDFTLPSTHRFGSSPLQVAVTTNGKGCRMAARIRREIVAKLYSEIGKAVDNVGQLKELARAEYTPHDDSDPDPGEEIVSPSPNEPVPQLSRESRESEEDIVRRRMKWVAQVSEYWSIPHLAKLTDESMRRMLNDDYADVLVQEPSRHSLHGRANGIEPAGQILLIGSGPGHPSLLTVAARTALTEHAQVVLADKLVPEAVLQIIPHTVSIMIARKFPGNAERAQQELLDAGLAAARAGKVVVRLKQGDPMLYGRAGEEILFFRAHGFEPLVFPGVSAALAAPLFAGIPVTQRGVADSLVVCTGVGAGGKATDIPPYVRARTLIVLMGVARLEQLLEALRSSGYPSQLPMAIIERASMPDQRVLTSSIADMSDGLSALGEHRPPGLIVIGWAVLALCGDGNVSMLNASVSEESDKLTIQKWLGSTRWKIVNGMDWRWNTF